MRKTFVFSDDAVDGSEKLKQRSSLGSNSDAIRVALQNLQGLLDVVEQNGTIVFRDANGNERVWHPLLEPAT